MSDWLKHIESYVHGTLSAEETQAFEEQMVTDTQLATRVKQYRAAEQALELGVENDLRDQLKKLSQSKQKQDGLIRRFIVPNMLSIAASIALFAVAGYWFFSQETFSSNQVADNYIQFELGRSRGSAYPDDLAKGFELLESKQLDEAIIFFEAVAKVDADQFTAHFILADLYHQNDELNKAKRELEIILDGESLIWKEKAQINYLYIARDVGWNERAENILKEILADSFHPFHNHANRIDRNK